jgi:hypothetical protein
MSSAHTLATKVHSYRSGEDEESLKKAVADVFAEISKGTNDDETSDFDELEGIPIEIATSVITALAASGNNPIGGVPPVNISQKKSNSNKSSSNPPEEDDSSYGFFIFLIIIYIIFFRKKAKK